MDRKRKPVRRARARKGRSRAAGPVVRIEEGASVDWERLLREQGPGRILPAMGTPAGIGFGTLAQALYGVDKAKGSSPGAYTREFNPRAEG